MRRWVSTQIILLLLKAWYTIPNVCHNVDIDKLAGQIKNKLLKEKEDDVSGLPDSFFHPARLAWILANAKSPYHTTVLQGFELAFGTLLKWFATLDKSEMDNEDWVHLEGVVTTLCFMIYSAKNKNLYKLAESLAILIERKKDVTNIRMQTMLNHAHDCKKSNRNFFT